MRSVGPTPDSDLAGPVPGAREPGMSPLAAMQHFGGNRAMAALLTEGQAAPQAPPIVTGAPGPAPAPALEDPDFNPTVRAHDLVRAIDSAEHTYRMKSSGLLGSEEDVEAERRKIDFPVVLAALDGLTASQVQKVEEVFYSFDRKATLSECLFGLGESGRRADLTDDQKARLRVLMAGTRPEPIPPHVMAELRRLPPQVAGELKADLEQRADAEPALRRHEADAIELHELLTGDLNEARRERIMAMHRRKPEETRAVDAMYAKNYGAGTLATDLNKRLDGLQRMRMTALRQGDVAQADAFAIEDKRRRIEALNEQDESMSSGFMGGGLHDDVLREQHRRQRQQLTGEIQAIIEQNKQEALTEAVRTGRGAGEAVAERIGKIMEAGVGAPGHTLGADLGRTLGKEDAAVVASLTDVWNTAGSGNLVQAAAAQLAADERAGTTSAKKIMATLQSFRTMAAQDLRAQAFDPRTPVEQKLAIQRDGENGVTRLAQRYIDEYRAAYDRIAAGSGRSFDQIVGSADDADEALIRNLSYGGGRTSDLGLLEHAMGKRDVGAVMEILRRQPNAEKVKELEAAYNGLGSGRDLRRQLFGVTLHGGTASPEQAQSSDGMAAVGGLVRGRDAALVAEQFGKPTEAALAGPDAGAAAQATWYAEGGRSEYDATWVNRGATGRLRQLGDDPETQRLLERSRDELAALKARFDAERDPAQRARLVEEMRKLRGALTGDAAAYEKDNERVLGEIRSALSFAVSIALAVAIPGAGAGLVAFMQTTALNIAASVATNFVIKGGDYGLADLKADVLGGVLGAAGGKFGEELLGRVAAAVTKPAAETAAETATRMGVDTVLSREVGSLATAGEKVAIRAEEFEIRAASREVAETVTKETAETATREAGEAGVRAEAAAAVGAGVRPPPITIWEQGAREVGGFFGGIYGPKVLTGDYKLTIDEVLKALAATAAGKIAHRDKTGKPGEEPAGRPGEEPARRTAEEETAGPRPEEEPAARRPEEDADGTVPAEGGPPATGFAPEPVPADALGGRSPGEMLLDNGIPPASAEGFQRVADVFNVVIKVRPTNTASLPVLDAGGVAKPELVKAKTVNRVDLLIGAPPDGVGKVGFFEPVMPSKQILDLLTPEAQQAVADRFRQRADEYGHLKDYYDGLAAEGLVRVRDGVLQIADPLTAATAEARLGRFKDIGGDHDLYEMTSADGTPLNDDVRRGVVKLLQSLNINVGHGDHVSWPKDSPDTHDPPADVNIRKQHETTQPLVAFVPKSQPREVMAGEAVTGPPRTEGPGDRFLPASGGRVVEPDPAGPAGPAGREGETDFSVPPRHATPEEIAGARRRATSDEVDAPAGGGSGGRGATGLKTPEAARAETLDALGDVPAATRLGDISPGQPLAKALGLFDHANPEVAAGLRTAYDALTNAEQVADTVARVQARAIDLSAQGVSKPFEVALRGIDGKLTTLHLDLRNDAEAFLAAMLDLSKRRPDGVVTVIPGHVVMLEDAFFLQIVTKGEPFLDISAIVQTDPSHGAASHLLQDLIVDTALERAGSALTSADLRRSLAPPAGEGTVPRAFAWEHIWDSLDNVINNPNVLNARLRKVFGDLDVVLAKIDKDWAALNAK